MTMFKRGRVGIATGYIIGDWVCGLIIVITNSEQYNSIGGNLWSILGRALSWTYWVGVAVV